jgi:hypothetical protein
MRFDISTAVKIHILILWVMAPCILVGDTNVLEEHTTILPFLMLELAVCSFKTSVLAYQTTRRYNPEEHSIRIFLSTLHMAD